jgi:hypothetical protein
MTKEEGKINFEIEDWAKQVVRNRSHTCQTCKTPGVKDAVRKVLELRVEGKSSASLSALHGVLVDHYNYPFSVSSLRYHVRKCERELWARIRGV